MSNYDVLNNTIQPYKRTILNGATLLESSQGKYIVKKQTVPLEELFNYLESQNVLSHPDLLKSYSNDDYAYKYVEELAIFKEQKLADMARDIARIHKKTMHNKKISVTKLEQVKNDFIKNMNFIEVWCKNLFIKALEREFMPPHLYLFSRNYNLYISIFDYLKEFINKWYDIKTENRNVRVSIVHNNLKLDHYIKNASNSIFISWDKYTIDTPILDIINFYKNEGTNLDLENFIKIYFDEINIEESEMLFFFINVMIIKTIELKESEIENVKAIRESINYIKKTLHLLETYYSKEQKEE